MSIASIDGCFHGEGIPKHPDSRAYTYNLNNELNMIEKLPLFFLCYELMFGEPYRDHDQIPSEEYIRRNRHVTQFLAEQLARLQRSDVEDLRSLKQLWTAEIHKVEPQLKYG